jgi:hypothetical protein
LRQAAAFVVSALFHVVMLALVFTSPWRPYALPEAAPPPEEVEIIRTPQEEPEPPQKLPPIPQTPPTPAPQAQPEREPTPVVQPQPLPQPQPPEPPKPEPAKPAPPRVETVRPVVIPTPAAPAAARLLRPLNAPTLQAPPVLAPIPEPEARPAAPAAPAHAAAPAQPAPTAAQLHPRKSEHEAPAGVPTLPLTPAPASHAAPGGGAPAGGGGGGGGGPAAGSRLQGLNPYPGGVFPGGTGLRGSLVGCANAEAVSLSSVERAHCAERFGTSAGTAPHLDPIPAARRSAFEQEAAKRDRDRAYRDSSTSAGMATGMGGIPPQESGSTVRLPQ